MLSLEDTVVAVVEEFLKNSELFTALDVSNKVKETIPSARHRKVRDIVRSMWAADIEPFSYGKAPIDVNLADGSVVQALLYHPLADSWDLDAKYDAQKRSQSSKQAASAQTSNLTSYPTIPPSIVGTLPAGVSGLTAQPGTTPNTVSATSIDPWGSLFGTQPSLFPRR